MRIVLCTVPVSDPTQPGLAVPCLTSALAASGHEVIQEDISIQAFHWLTSAPTLSAARGRLERSDEHDVNQRTYSVEPSIETARIMAKDTIEFASTAKAIFKDENRFYDYSTYKQAYYGLRNALELLSAAYAPTQVGFVEYDMGLPWTPETIQKHVGDPNTNALLPFFQDHALDRILSHQPELIGLSITYKSQFLPGLTLAGLLRWAAPRIPLVLGGAYLTALADRMPRYDFLRDFCHCIVLYEGESALVEIARRVQRGQSLHGIPNVFQPGDALPANLHVEDLKDLPSPDFSGLPLDRYLTPHPVLPIQSSRGCYWGKCAFCSVSRATRSTYRRKPLHCFMQEMTELSTKYGSNVFFICDDATDLHTLHGIADHIVQNELPFYWVTEARFESGLDESLCSKLAQGGCLHLIFGFESASQRVLNMMGKGTRIERIHKVLRACRKSKIAVNLQCFLGFPGETEEEAQSTEEFFYRNRDLYLSLGAGHFLAMDGSAVSCRPEDFGVHLLQESEETVVPWQDIEIIGAGMDRESSSTYFQAMMQRLRNDDILGPGFMCGSTDTHGLLYLSVHGLNKVRMLGSEVQRLDRNLMETNYRPAQDIAIRPLGNNQALIFFQGGGAYHLVDLQTAHVVEQLGKGPSDMASAALLGLKEPDFTEPDQITDLAQIMAELTHLARLGMLKKTEPAVAG